MNDLEIKWRIVEDPGHSLENAKWVRIIAHIKNTDTGEVRKTDTGEVRKYETDAIKDDDSTIPCLFIWEEGNFSCDCNRALFFGYATGVKYDDIDHPCGNGGFLVNLENPVTGEIFYKEF